MNGRREDIDTAKCLGMLLVIIGHSQPPELLQTAIYGMHMPLFFFISGILWRGQVRLSHSAHALLRPFLLASLASWVLWMVKRGLHPSGDTPWWGPLLVTAWGGDLNGWLVHNTPLWFLPAMLSLLTVLWLLGRALAPQTALAALSTLGLFFLFLPAGWQAGHWPMALGQGIVGGIFFALGHFARHRLPPRWPLAGLLALAVSVSLALLNGRVDLFTMQFQQPLLYLSAGIIGAWGLVSLCTISQLQLPVLQLLGRHSLLILAVHMPVLWLLRGALRAAGLPEHWLLLALPCGLLMVLLSLWRDRLNPAGNIVT